jgi:hypothetical protein
MRRVVIGATVVAAAAALAGSASASPPPSASCVAILTSYEATQLPAASVGAEVSGLAGPGFGQVVSALAASHLGTLDDCAAIAP